MVLVILIALWAVVLVPPYLKDRRASTRAFRTSQSGSLPVMNAAQRFTPLQNAGPAVRSSVPQAMSGPAVAPVSAAMQSAVGGPSNVVPLHPLAVDEPSLYAPRGDESTIQAAWEGPRHRRAAVPSTTSAARERRRHVLLALTGAAFVTLLLALTLGGAWVATHVAIDAALVGYVVLLVRFRQLAAERRTKVEPIRPPVNEVAPATLQAAPAYLLRSGT